MRARHRYQRFCKPPRWSNTELFSKCSYSCSCSYIQATLHQAWKLTTPVCKRTNHPRISLPCFASGNVSLGKTCSFEAFQELPSSCGCFVSSPCVPPTAQVARREMKPAEEVEDEMGDWSQAACNTERNPPKAQTAWPCTNDTRPLRVAARPKNQLYPFNSIVALSEAVKLSAWEFIIHCGVVVQAASFHSRVIGACQLG